MLAVTTEILMLLLFCWVPQLACCWDSVPENAFNRPKLSRITVQSVSQWKQLKMVWTTAGRNFLQHHCYNLYLDTVRVTKA